MQYDFYIGIDSGTKTGFAIWDKKQRAFVEVKTMMIHTAMLKVLEMHKEGKRIFVRVEDARKATAKRTTLEDYHRLQGAGSVKRDAAIWECFLKDYSIPHQMVRPNKALTKLGKYTFEIQTRYRGVTSEHGRDAAMLVFGL